MNEELGQNHRLHHVRRIDDHSQVEGWFFEAFASVRAPSVLDDKVQGAPA